LAAWKALITIQYNIRLMKKTPADTAATERVIF